MSYLVDNKLNESELIDFTKAMLAKRPLLNRVVLNVVIRQKWGFPGIMELLILTNTGFHGLTEVDLCNSSVCYAFTAASELVRNMEFDYAKYLDEQDAKKNKAVDG